MAFWNERDDGVVISVKVIPKSSKSAIVGVEGKELKIRLAAIPEKGEANQELIRFLAKTLKVSKSQFTILSGETSRHKKILITGVDIKDFSF